MPLTENSIRAAYAAARSRYDELGVDTEWALRRLSEIPLSLHCWQGDDVAGFERSSQDIGGGLAVTGRYPGKARDADELRFDLEMALSLIPGQHRVNLHASYAETNGVMVQRDELQPCHFQAWMDWARQQGLGLDFNPTYFAHPLAADGFTLTHPDPGIRRFWIDHGIACRRIAAAMGQAQGTASVCNIWIPDGSKDQPVDRSGPRRLLAESLDILLAERLDAAQILDTVECKLFGLGSESYVTGSHEFYLGYAITRGTMLCLDSGHFHPTEVISDKISAVLSYVPSLLLHVSRGIRWDSDHVVTLSDDVQAIAQEVVRGGYLDRVRFGLDYFDASINRIAAWVIGSRCVLRALLLALLEPLEMLRTLELERDFTSRLAVLEELRTLPSGAVWDYYCLIRNVPAGPEWLRSVQHYEQYVLCRRNDGEPRAAAPPGGSGLAGGSMLPLENILPNGMRRTGELRPDS